MLVCGGGIKYVQWNELQRQRDYDVTDVSYVLHTLGFWFMNVRLHALRMCVTDMVKQLTETAVDTLTK